MAGQTPSTNRRNQQQQFMQGVAGMYVPGASQPYAQQLMSQYQVNSLDMMIVYESFRDIKYCSPKLMLCIE